MSAGDERPDTHEPKGSAGMPRRTFVKIAGVVGAVILSEPDLTGAAHALAPAQIGPVPDDDDVVYAPPGPAFARSFRRILRRREDMVRLQVEGYNLRISRTTPSRPRLQLVDAGANGLLVITFPPQALLEEALDPDVNPTPGSIGARLSGESRLAFIVPKESVGSGIRFDSAGLLDWSDWFLATTVAARRSITDGPIGGSIVRPAEPTNRETSIEAPWWLQVSPNRRGGFVASPDVVVGEGSGNTELWHARFATRPGIGANFGPLTENPSPNRTIRAIWSPDPDLADLLPNPIAANGGGEPFAASLTQRDRVSLIRLTADDVLPGSATGRVAVPVTTLTLSALGADIDMGQQFADATAISLVAWRHRATLGRDHYVRVVDRGYLMPFGHRASLIRVTERKFIGAGTDRAAVLEQREFLVVTQPVVDHDLASTMPTGGRQVPFGRVRILDNVTPDIFKTALSGSGQQTANCFFPRLGDGSDLVFQVVATDRDGRSVDAPMSMVFVNGAIAENPVEMASVRAAWNALNHPTRRWTRLSGRRVAYAPSLAQRPGATSVITDRIRFDVTALADETLPETPGFQRFWAALDVAEVRLEEIESISANTVGATTLTYDPVYRDDGFDSPSNAGGMWAAIGGVAGIPLRFSRPPAQADQPGPGTDRAGGVISPDLQIRGLSRALGVAAGDPQALRNGSFDPTSFFAGPASPKLLGGISLLDVIVPASIPVNSVAPPSALAIVTRRTDDAIESAMVWTPDLKSDPAGIFTPGTLRLDALVRTPLDGSDATPSTRLDGELSDFAINIPDGDDPLISIQFDRLRFASRDGRQPEVDVDVRDVLFGGELEYIATLSEYLDFGLGGIDIAVLPDRVAVSLAIALPNLTFGVFALRNVRFAAGLDVPLSGEPVRMRFAFSTRDDPFRLTVLGIGGGGYVALAFGTDGLETLELCLEGGAEVALDFGIASGSVSMMFGAVLVVDEGGGVDSVSWMAYFRMNGSVSAGPVSACVTLAFELGYQKRTKNGKTVSTLYGRAYLEIDISVPLLPTPPVLIKFERSFKSDAADPTFADQLAPADWDDYCNAYGAA